MIFIPRSTEKKIGGINYTIQEMLAVQRDELLFESAEIMGQALTLMAEGYFTEAEPEVSVALALQGVIRDGNGTPEQKAAFIKKLIISSVKSPKSAADEYDLHFMSNYEHRAELIFEIFKLNFGAAIQNLKKKLQSFGIFTRKSSENSPAQNEEIMKNEPGHSSLKVNYLNG